MPKKKKKSKFINKIVQQSKWTNHDEILDDAENCTNSEIRGHKIS